LDFTPDLLPCKSLFGIGNSVIPSALPTYAPTPYPSVRLSLAAILGSGNSDRPYGRKRDDR
ncbi:MAG: hypothetical protein M0Z81_14800, partial [Deltaproteobacteria bacterium]|nr:hypothetical protein [Deltaproteobacteria bacterium]